MRKNMVWAFTIAGAALAAWLILRPSEFDRWVKWLTSGTGALRLDLKRSTRATPTNFAQKTTQYTLGATAEGMRSSNTAPIINPNNPANVTKPSKVPGGTLTGIGVSESLPLKGI